MGDVTLAHCTSTLYQSVVFPRAKEDAISTREKIVQAATEIIRGGTASPSVRTVAARAGVGASTLRHYFPTQRALIDATLQAFYAEAMPDARIRETTIPPRERLAECLAALLEPFSDERQARETWKTVYESFISPSATEDARQAFVVLARQAEMRVASWLSILEEEGALPAGDTDQRAHFLIAVIDGLSLDRALPPLHARVDAEARTLRMAVDAVFAH